MKNYLLVFFLLPTLLPAQHLTFKKSFQRVEGAAIHWNVFDSELGSDLKDVVNTGRELANTTTELLNPLLDPIPFLDTVGTIGMWDPELTVAAGDSAWTTRSLWGVGRSGRGNEWYILFGNSAVDPSVPEFGIEGNVFPLEFLSQKQLFKILNLSRAFSLGGRATVDLANPSLLVPGWQWGIRADIALVGEMIRLNLAYTDFNEIPLAFAKKPAGLRMDTKTLSADLIFTLSTRRYSGEVMPFYWTAGAYSEMVWAEGNGYVPLQDKLIKDAGNIALDANRTFNQLLNELGERVNVNVNLNTEPQQMDYDSVPPLQIKKARVGTNFGLGFDEKMATLGLEFRKTDALHIRGQFGLYPGFFLRPVKLLRLGSQRLYWDARKSLNLGVVLEHDQNIPSEYRNFLDFGPYGRVAFPLLVGKRTYLSPYAQYTRVQSKHQSNTLRQTLALGVNLSFTFEDYKSIDPVIIAATEGGKKQLLLKKADTVQDEDKREELLEKVEKLEEKQQEKKEKQKERVKQQQKKKAQKRAYQKNRKLKNKTIREKNKENAKKRKQKNRKRRKNN